MMEHEWWTPIEGFNGYVISSTGIIYSLKSSKLLQPFFTHNGYLAIKLIDDSGKRKKKRVHRLVMENFRRINDELMKKYEVDHINNIRYDNNITNLKWVTRFHNVKKMRDRRKALKTLKEKFPCD